MKHTPALEQLIDALRCLPGVGPRSAQRMSLHLLERNRQGANALAVALQHAMSVVNHCERCRNYTEHDLCEICTDHKRDSSTICVVETPAHVVAIESSGSYRGMYYVLMGHLSPIDGIGPQELGLDKFHQRVLDDAVQEVVLATNPTVEGEATAWYLTDLLSADGVTVSRIAHGVPLGGELDYVDGSTLAHALSSRQAVKPT